MKVVRYLQNVRTEAALLNSLTGDDSASMKVFKVPNDVDRLWLLVKYTKGSSDTLFEVRADVYMTDPNKVDVQDKPVYGDPAWCQWTVGATPSSGDTTIAAYEKSLSVSGLSTSTAYYYAIHLHDGFMDTVPPGFIRLRVRANVITGTAPLAAIDVMMQ